MANILDDLPDLADVILSEAGTDPSLGEALVDYRRACERSNDRALDPGERREWAQVRTELISELQRLALRSKEKKAAQLREIS